MSVAAMTLGVLFAAGLLLVVSGLRQPRPRRPGNGIAARALALRPPSPERALLVLAASVGVLVLTRWPVIAVATGVAAWWLSGREAKEQASTIERTEALAAWAEMLRDATGTPRGISGIVAVTSSTVPLVIRPAVTRFANNIAGAGDFEAALSQLADDLDDPTADLIVSALRLAYTAGGRDLRSVLDGMSRAARNEAGMRRRLEVSRQRPRSEMHQVIAIVAGVVLFMSLFSRDYLAPYNSVGGQIVLGAAAALWVVGVTYMARLGQVPPMRRFLTRRVET